MTPRRDVDLQEILEFLQILHEEIKYLRLGIKDLRLGIIDQREAGRISYNLREAASLTGLATDTLYKYYKSGKLPGSQPTGPGGTIVILKRDLMEFIGSRRDQVFSIEKQSKHP